MVENKVVIVGGGNAGLAAAHALKKEGIDFVVLEASNRYGGRVGRGTHKDYTFSTGAYFTEPQWDTTFEYLKEFGLEDDVITLDKKVYGFWYKNKVEYFVDEGNLFGAILKFRGLPPAIIPQGAKFAASLGLAMNKIKGEDDFSGLDEISNQSTAEWATKNGGPEVVDKLIGPMLGMMVLEKADAISAAHPIALMKLMAGMCVVKGGLKRVNDAIYEGIKDNVRLNTPVKQIVIQDGEVQGVKLENGEYIATDNVICCTDAVTALEIMPNSPLPMRKALATCKYSRTFHYVFELEKRNVPEDFLAMFIPLSTDSLLTTIFDENTKYIEPGHEEMGLIHVFTAGWHDDKFLPLNEDERRQLVLDEVEKFYPGFSQVATEINCTRYEKAVNTEPPGQYSEVQNFVKNHRDDIKGLNLAGEYLFLIACTEGAWSTGKEAAERVIASKK
jgi:protoporphyrinogen oxidase